MFKYAIHVFIVLLFLQAAHAKEHDHGTYIVKNNKSEYAIVIPNKAVEGVSAAANELKRLMRKSTGIAFSIATSNKKYSGKALYVGYSSWMKDIIDVKKIELDGYEIFEDGKNIYFIGQDDSEQSFYKLNTKQSASAGTYFAVVDFARKFLRAKWFMPGESGEEVVKVSELRVPNGEILQGKPKYAIRYIDIMNTVSKRSISTLHKSGSISHIYFDAQQAQLATEWGRRMKLGSNHNLPVSHAWHRWVPAEAPTVESPSVYGKSNPEYFAQSKKQRSGYYYGNGRQHGGQLCICNSELVKVFAENIVRYAKASGSKDFSLSPNDGNWDCNCSCCKATPDNFKSGTKELTDEVIRFSNNIADQVLEEIPDARFGLYAYSWMSEPPKKYNVKDEVRISTVYNGLGYQAYLDNRTTAIEANLSQWREKSSHTTLTTYFSFYGHYSMPWAGIAGHEWLADFLLDGATSDGLRMNYAIHNIAPVGLMGAGPWVLSQLLWGSDGSYAALEEEYYRGAFGVEAGRLVKEYFYLIDNAMNDAVKNVPFQGSSGVRKYILEAYGPIREACRNKINAARLAVKDLPPRYKQRFEKVAKGWEYAELTLDVIDAERNNNYKAAKVLANKRRKMLADAYLYEPFSIAPVAADYFNSIVPLVQ